MQTRDVHPQQQVLFHNGLCLPNQGFTLRVIELSVDLAQEGLKCEASEGC